MLKIHCNFVELVLKTKLSFFSEMQHEYFLMKDGVDNMFEFKFMFVVCVIILCYRPILRY